MRSPGFGTKWAVPFLWLTAFVIMITNAFSATVVFNSSEDTFIDEYAPGSNRGSDNFVIVRRGGTGFELDALVLFDLSSLPSGTVINSATLNLYYWHWNDYDPANRLLNVHRITSSWSEATVTWNTRPGYNPVPIASANVPADTSNWMSFDVTGEVQSLVNGSFPNYGWQVMDPNTLGFPMIYFRSKEYGSYIPYLEVDTGLVQPGWYWKSEYPNYAPSGMPDFDMKQDNWKAIFPGLNGTLESSPSGDDFVPTGGNMIVPGTDCRLQSTPSGDDYADWIFSGPTALANCFWWFDSKYAYPSGYPGDGADTFTLVEGYYATNKVVDQEQPYFDSFIDIVPYNPGHVQSFVPTVSALDAVQLLLKFNYPNEPTTIEVSIYGSLPDNAGVSPLGTSVMITPGPWAETWYQFHFSPAVTLTPGSTYYIAARILGGDGNPQWCYSWEDPYLSGMAWTCSGDYTLTAQADWDFTFKTEYYASGNLDDHEADNVPELIRDLSYTTGTCTNGFTDPDSMQAAIDEWLAGTNLDEMFTESTYTAPEFELIEEEIERSQDVILLLGFYGAKLVDQQQTQSDYKIDLYPWPAGHLQEFTPTVNTLDAVELLLMADSVTPTTLEVSIYDAFPNTASILPIGRSIMVVSVPWSPTWLQFHFEPAVPLTAGGLYYIAVRTLDVTNNVEWCYISQNAYGNGEAWFNWDNYYFQSEPNKDFGFKTEYYEGDDCEKRAQRYVTCAGVNSDYYQIAFSDPYCDIREGSMGAYYDHTPHPLDPTVHNDPQYVSHDIYNVSLQMPCPLPYTWWLPDYPSGYKFTLVEEAIIICPTEECDCEPGNCDGNTSYNMLDILYLISFLYKSGPAPVPYVLCSGDANCDCTTNMLDILYLISFLYKSGPAPCSCQQWLINCGPPLRK